VVGEISELKVNYSGHCYLELVEKDPDSQTLKAKARATIWSSVFRMIQPLFRNNNQGKTGSGNEGAGESYVEFHELYGLSLNITDIEPSYTLGETGPAKAGGDDR